MTGQSLFFGVSTVLTMGLVVELWMTCTGWRRWLVGWTVVCLSTLALLIHGIANSFTGEGINEATWYHVRFGMRGLQFAQIAPFLGLAGMVGLAGGILAVLSARRCLRLRRLGGGAVRGSTGRRGLGLAVLLSVLPTNPAVLKMGQEAWFHLFRSSHQADMRAAIRTPTFRAPVRPRSLVYIYAESLERTFMNGQHFPGLTPRLAEMEAEGLSVHGMAQAPFTGWTIAGMKASQCGLPLVDEAAVPCLGDVLASGGYTQVFIGGADAEFAGKGEFLRQHGFSSVIDKNQLYARVPAAVQSDWGIHDVDLFSVARTEFSQLLSSGRPFALMLLTLGTHPPNGNPDAQCALIGPYGDGRNAMLNAVHCSDTQMAEFVAWVQAQAPSEVVVVVASDHLQMNSSAHEMLTASGLVRENLWLAVGGGVEQGMIRRPSTQFDVAPTVLGLLGWDVPAMGWGRDLRGKTPTLLEQWGERRMFQGVKSLYALDGEGMWSLEARALDTPTTPEGVNSP